MPRPSVAQVRERLATSFTLDHLWRETMGLPKGDSKEPALAELTDLLRKAHTAYALIGGVAVQLYSEEPRTTADIDVALASYDDLPRGRIHVRASVRPLRKLACTRRPAPQAPHRGPIHRRQADPGDSGARRRVSRPRDAFQCGDPVRSRPAQARGRGGIREPAVEASERHHGRPASPGDASRGGPRGA